MAFLIQVLLSILVDQGLPVAQDRHPMVLVRLAVPDLPVVLVRLAVPDLQAVTGLLVVLDLLERDQLVPERAALDLPMPVVLDLPGRLAQLVKTGVALMAKALRTVWQQTMPTRPAAVIEAVWQTCSVSHAVLPPNQIPARRLV
ncbi:MAG: hypothetical protein AAFQ04_06445 [Pseudomonadota bacterium]